MTFPLSPPCFLLCLLLHPTVPAFSPSLYLSLSASPLFSCSSGANSLTCVFPYFDVHFDLHCHFLVLFLYLCDDIHTFVCRHLSRREKNQREMRRVKGRFYVCTPVKPLEIKLEQRQASKKEADISIVSISVSPETRCSSLALLEMTNLLKQHKQYATAPEGNQPLKQMLE